MDVRSVTRRRSPLIVVFNEPARFSFGDDNSRPDNAPLKLFARRAEVG